jgi:hypothetical protein
MKMSKKTIKNCDFKTPIEKHDTAAWSNAEKTEPVTNIAIPSETETINAKEWVDSNEK